MRQPKFKLAHTGFAASQSAHVPFPATLFIVRMVTVSAASAPFFAFVIIKGTLLINHYNKNKLTIFRVSIVHVDF